MSINRGMDKESMVYIYHEILLSHKKEWNWVICGDVDRSRDCHREWREKQISYINTYVWYLKNWCRQYCLQSRNRDTVLENKCMDTKEGRRSRMNGETGIYIHTLLMCWCAQSWSTLCDLIGLYPTRFFSPWNFPGKNTGVGGHFHLQYTIDTRYKIGN